MPEITVKRVKRKPFSTARFEGFYYIVRTTKDVYGSEDHEYLWPNGTWFTHAWSGDSNHTYYKTKQEIKAAVSQLIQKEKENV
jgi:hypothetical protein